MTDDAELRRELDKILYLRETAIYQGPHWTEEPTKEMQDQEERWRKESKRNAKKLRKAVKRFCKQLIAGFEK